MAGEINLMGKSDLANLVEIAKFAIGSDEATTDPNAKIKGGAGRIGIINGHVVKFNTHLGERLRGPKADDKMRQSCNQLRRTIYNIASRLRLDKGTINAIRDKLGLDSDGLAPANAKLLDRKVVASVINMIGKGKNDPDYVWSKLRVHDVTALKSTDAHGKAIDTHFSRVAEQANALPSLAFHGPSTANLANNLWRHVGEFLAGQEDTGEIDIDTIVKDIQRGMVVKLGDQTLKSDSSAETVRESFKDFFKDEALARVVARLACQTALTPMKAVACQSLGGPIPDFTDNGHGELSVVISARKDGRYRMKGTILKKPTLWTVTDKNNNVEVTQLDEDRSHASFEGEYEFRKLGPAETARADEHVVQMGGGRIGVSLVRNSYKYDVEFYDRKEDTDRLQNQ